MPMELKQLNFKHLDSHRTFTLNYPFTLYHNGLTHCSNLKHPVIQIIVVSQLVILEDHQVRFYYVIGEIYIDEFKIYNTGLAQSKVQSEVCSYYISLYSDTIIIIVLIGLTNWWIFDYQSV